MLVHGKPVSGRDFQYKGGIKRVSSFARRLGISLGRRWQDGLVTVFLLLLLLIEDLELQEELLLLENFGI